MKNLICAMVLMTSLASTFVFAGNEMGNGTDHFTGDYGAAWFTGEGRVVSFCIEVDSRFGRRLDQVRADIQSAWGKWMDYVSVKSLYGQ